MAGGCCCGRSICYDVNTADESFEWTQIRGAPSTEVQVLPDKMDLHLLQARPPDLLHHHPPLACTARKCLGTCALVTRCVHIPAFISARKLLLKRLLIQHAASCQPAVEVPPHSCREAVWPFPSSER